MNNDHRDNHNTRGLPFPHTFNFGTTLQNVFRNINHAFTGNHDSGGVRRASSSRNPTDNNVPPIEPLNSVGGRHNTYTTNAANPSPTLAAPEPSTSSALSHADADMPPHPHPHPQFDSERDEDEDSMPELHSPTESSNASDPGLATLDLVPPHQNIQPADEDRSSSVRADDEADPPLEPITGIRRARVDDDGDEARDRRHPSERVGAPPPGDAAPQIANPQQPPRPPPIGLFGALFGPRHPEGDAPHERTHTGEGTAGPSPAHAPLGVPIFTAGFTMTIPLFGPPPGDRTDPGAAGHGGAPGAFGMDAASREELLASFAAFFQEFQGLDETREDPERAKKLVTGLEVVPLGLVKRLERVGGAPGAHGGDSSTEGGSSGCAICWDTLLNGESDSFRQLSAAAAPEPSGTNTAENQDETHAEGDVMDVDAPPASHSHSEPGTSTSILPSSEPVKIISLPCAHVFHASCLLPWFTRARQATCPTCRFNIDPENLTYTPQPRRAFDRGPPAQPDHAVPNPVPADPRAVPEVPLEVLGAGAPAAGAAVPPADSAPATTDAHPTTTAPGPVPRPPTEQSGVPLGGPGFNPFVGLPGVPIMSFPAIQIPLRPAAAQAPGGGNQGIDIVTIGLDMFAGGPPPEERGGDRREDAGGADGTDNGRTDTGATDGNGGANPNGLSQDLHSLIEGLWRTTRDIIPQVINPQGPEPAPVPGAPPAEDAQPQPQPQVRPVPEAGGPQPAPPNLGGPRFVQFHPFRPGMFRPTRPMPPRRERKAWALPPAPGPSLRQRVEQREREQGLRCSDTSCGVGPSDDDPYPELSASSTKQVFIHPLPDPDHPGDGGHGSVCAHVFHPACLVSAERVAGWGGEDRTEPLVEVSCPVCRDVGCVTREEWESGVSAL